MILSNKHIGWPLVFLVMMTSFFEVEAQRRGTSSGRTMKSDRTVSDQRMGTQHRNDRYYVQPIRRSPHYRYPRHTRVITTLPVHHVRIVHRGLPYYYFGGVYYTAYGSQYVVVMPPVGFRITVLPVGYVRIVVGPSIYYYHSGVYYSETTVVSNEVSEPGYEVTTPPVGIEVSELPEDAEPVTIEGQTYYEYNDVLYKEQINSSGTKTYKVVYNKNK